MLLSAMARADTPMLDLIDIPTADVVDHYGADMSFRSYSNGGVLTKTAFGVFPRFNVGFGLDAERFIGSQSVQVNRPTLNMKFRAYDGSRSLPSLALGYDGQGYFFNRATNKYSEREKGLYGAGSGEIFTPGLSLDGGLNIFDFKKDSLHAFAGLLYMYQETVGALFEADNLVGRSRDNRFNLGARYCITPGLSVDLAGRDLWAAGRKAERILRLSYSTSF